MLGWRPTQQACSWRTSSACFVFAFPLTFSFLSSDQALPLRSRRCDTRCVSDCLPSTSQTYLKFVEQLLQRHLLFRNTLQERLSAEHWKSLVGDILVQLIGHNDASGSSPLSSGIFLSWMRRPPEKAHGCCCCCSAFYRLLSPTCTSVTPARWRPSSRWSSTGCTSRRAVRRRR